MKSIKRLLFASILIIVLTVAVISVSATDATLTVGVTPQANEVATNIPENVVSCGLYVIAEQNQMTVAGLKGNMLNFSPERFACAMNLSRVDSITVVSLPDISAGSLYIGSEGVSVGQKLSANDIALMTYEEAREGEGIPTSFEFTVNGSTYAMTCNIYMIDDINYCPTVSMASYASLNAETYKNIKVSGVLSGYDPEGDEIVFEIVKYPARGRLELEDRTTGKYTYIPDESYTGEDSFSYVIQDKYGNYSASATVTLTVNAQSTSASYADLLEDEVYTHAIAMTEFGLMNGVKVGGHYYFEPEREVSRAEFIVTAMNAIGISSVPEVESTGFFDDEKISPEMKGYIALAYSKGFISGKSVEGNLCFDPDESIKLSEAAVIISNMIGYADAKVAPVFADADNIPEWSERAISSLHTLGILETPDKIAGAGDIITRGDMAKLLNKTMQVIGR